MNMNNKIRIIQKILLFRLANINATKFRVNRHHLNNLKKLRYYKNNKIQMRKFLKKKIKAIVMMIHSNTIN